MNKLTIIPETIDGKYVGNYKDEDVVRASFCYLHGELQYINGYDIFSILKSDLSENQIEEDKWVSEELKEGVYPCTCMEKESTFFRWNNGRRFSGLVVLNSDTESYKYAEKCFNEKVKSI